MSGPYGPLAARYDALTGDVPYPALTDWYEHAFAQSGRAVRTVLDLCCGTGTLSLLLAERGYELICVDASAEMLSVFQQKLPGLPGDVAVHLEADPAAALALRHKSIAENGRFAYARDRILLSVQPVTVPDEPETDLCRL